MLRKMNVVAVVLGVVSVLCSRAVNAEPIRLTTSTDSIYAIWNTTAGGDSTASTEGLENGQWCPGLPASNALDGVTTTKYLNFGTSNNVRNNQSITAGVGTGFYVTPSIGTTVLTGFKMATADDESARDPLTITIEGSNATGTALTLGSNWTSIYSGTTGLDIDPGRNAWGELVSITNASSYSAYRMLVTSQAGVSNCTQYSEAAFYGSVVPEPSAIVLGITGLIGLLAYAWKKRR